MKDLKAERQELQKRSEELSRAMIEALKNGDRNEYERRKEEKERVCRALETNTREYIHYQKSCLYGGKKK